MFEVVAEGDAEDSGLESAGRASSPSPEGLEGLEQVRQAAAAPRASSRTRPVLVRLDGSVLSVWSGPAGGAEPRVPRLALWTENEASLRQARAALTTRRVYDLRGARVSLLQHSEHPNDAGGLPVLSRWSRRNPICVDVAERPVTDSVPPPADRVAVAERTSVSSLASSRPDAAIPTASDEPTDALGDVALRPPTIVVQSPSSSALVSGSSQDAAEAEGVFIHSVRSSRSGGLAVSHQSSASSGLVVAEAEEVDDVEEAQQQLLGQIVSQELSGLLEDDDEVDSGRSPPAPPRPGPPEHSVLLLARTARQKEEWFWRLRRACGQCGPGSHAPDDEALLDEYLAALQSCLTAADDLTGLNALLCRVMFGASRSPRWAALVQAAVQHRVDGLRLPAFLDRPRVSGFHCRPAVLTLRRPVPPSASPLLDRHGLWLELDVRFRGVLRLVLTTRLNLHPGPEQQQGGSWLLKKLADSSRLLQSALAALSHTDLAMAVEVRALDGALVAHVPPPPSDRLWLGFRAPPRLRLVVVPQVGHLALRHALALLCRLLERRLRGLAERLFVFPNMANVAVPFMGDSDASYA